MGRLSLLARMALCVGAMFGGHAVVAFDRGTRFARRPAAAGAVLRPQLGSPAIFLVPPKRHRGCEFRGLAETP